MITTLSIQLGNSQNLNHNSSSLFHGAMMEQLAPEVAEQLHSTTLRPYRQGISVEKEEIFWNITTLTAQAKENIITPLLGLSSLHLRHHQQDVPLLQKTIHSLSYDDLIQETYLATCPRPISLAFTSPTSFKQGGRYHFFPDIRLILQSAMKKFDLFSPQMEIFSRDLLEDLDKHCELSHYSLHSVRFHLESSKIPSFQGRISYYIKGPQALVNVVHLLCHYGQYAGIGVKSALGMGEMKVISERSHHDNHRI